MQKLLVAVLFLGAIATFFYIVSVTPRHAGMLLLNGTVYTLDERNTVAQAVALNGNHIVATGTSDELQGTYSAAQVIDLEGKTVMPGLIDGHAHLLGEGSRLLNVDLVGTRSVEEIVERVAERVGQMQPGQWVLGRGWDQNDWAVKEFPVSTPLDEIAPNNPVVLTRIDGHAVWTNRMAIERAGISAVTKDFEGGKIYRHADGTPTGIFVDNAMDTLRAAIPELSDDEIELRLKLVFDECVRLGLTGVHDMGVDMQTINVMKRMIDNGECPVRIYAAIGGPGETWNAYLRSGKEIGYGGGMLTVRAVKLYMDGALGSRGAALFDEYCDDPGNRGLTVMSEEEVGAICRQALEKGFQVCVHAIGDRGNHIVLNEYERALAALPPDAPSPRWRIEHAQVLRESDIPRFNQLKILPSMQPTHATSDMYWAETRLGQDRLKGAYAWQSLLHEGSIIIGGSDFPVESVSPLWGFYAAVSRSDHQGYPDDGWRAEEKMTREQAARAFTQWAAAGAFEDLSKGTIAPGKWADLTVLSRDIMQVPPAEILKTEVEMTIVKGKVVYRKEAAVPVP